MVRQILFWPNLVLGRHAASFVQVVLTCSVIHVLIMEDSTLVFASIPLAFLLTTCAVMGFDDFLTSS
jgi:hypothetical protein